MTLIKPLRFVCSTYMIYELWMALLISHSLIQARIHNPNRLMTSYFQGSVCPTALHTPIYFIVGMHYIGHEQVHTLIRSWPFSGGLWPQPYPRLVWFYISTFTLDCEHSLIKQPTDQHNRLFDWDGLEYADFGVVLISPF